SGYDRKHAMHLVRLMRMCREILTDGKVIVRRPDREELLAIRNGAWEYDQLIEWADRQDAEMTDLVEKSKLRKSPDRTYLDELCRVVVEGMLGC
ncbi:MAG: nucleotidyltransferase, partial [Candidatus Yanofskybacteria bacterium]|nr:nucleotidyltransferase [Candidatus Yanofskybacteria bacterium]